jgi:4-amino-4-deoxy-L-arabinose transferase-like glycosyltransferase
MAVRPWHARCWDARDAMRTDSSPLAATREEAAPRSPLRAAGGRNTSLASAASRGRLLLFVAAVLLVAVTTLFANLGRYPLWEPDEARHAEIAREMAARHSWLLPTLYGRPYHDKPVMYYWLTAAGYRVWGPDTVAARGVSALGALLTVAAVFWWALAVWGMEAAALSALTLVTTLEFFALGRFGDLNMLLTLFVTVGVLGVHRWEHRDGHGCGLVAAAGAAGLGALTKGLVAPVLIGAIALAHLASRGRLRLLRWREVLLAAVVFLAVVAPWYVAAGMRSPAYLRDFFLQHHLQRLVGGVRLHPEPFYFTIVATALCFLPWTFILPAALHRVLRGDRDEATGFCVAWAGAVVLLFSLPSGKLATYVLPAMPPLALLIGHYWSRLSRSTPDVRELGLLRFGLGALACLAIAAPPTAIAATAYLDGGTWLPVALLSLVLLPFGAVIAGLAHERRYEGAPLVLIVAMLVVCAAFYGYGAPRVSAVLSDAPIARIVMTADPTRHAPVVAFRTYGGSLPFYVDRPVRFLDSQRRLRHVLGRRRLVFIVTHPRHLRILRRMPTLWVWREKRHVLLATQPPPGSEEDRQRGVESGLEPLRAPQEPHELADGWAASSAMRP